MIANRCRPNKSSSTVILPCLFVLGIIHLIINGRVRESGGSSHIHSTETNASHVPVKSVDHIIMEEARRFVLQRQQAYESVGMGSLWKMRGLGYLYTNRDIVLAGVLPPTNSTSVGPLSIRIVNAHPKATMAKDDCDKLTIWVRVAGPEIFAGSATARPFPSIDSSCYWTFDVNIEVPGVYHIDAKALLWNGKTPDMSKNKCQVQHNTKVSRDIREQYPIHYGFQGFKVYFPDRVCCEICSRMRPYCKYWSSPPWKLPDPNHVMNGCELFFDQATPDDFIPRSHLLGDLQNVTLPHRRKLNTVEIFSGQPHSSESAYFVGCGWSQWFTLDFPCVSGELDDKVYFSTDSLQISGTGTVPTATEPLPLCTLENERMGQSTGRWVREPWPKPEACPGTMEPDVQITRFSVMKHDGLRPHCWHRDDLTLIGHNCVEMNCRLIRGSSKWISPMRSSHWNGVWRERTCDYLEYTDEQLQKCIDLRKIISMTTIGQSIASYLDVYLKQRVGHLRFFQNTSDPEAINVALSTMSMLHHAGDPDEPLRTKWTSELQKTAPDQELFVVSGFYLSSERETHTHVERMLQLSNILDDVAELTGSRFLNAFNLSAAFTFDTATQFDGMHLIGPPMKMIITKLFHHLCKSVVDGLRL